ncbi:MAG: FapA family protein [Roseburia sp.]|nr:FapA family protein [Roseburia sp.]
MNGYFQIQTDESGVSVLLSPPLGDGEPLRVGELKEYLDRIGVPYDSAAINSAFHKLKDEEIVVFLTPMTILPVDERCVVNVMADRLTAVLRMYPPSVGGIPLTRAKIMEALEWAKVKSGIDEAAIREALQDRQYCTDIVVARGSRPTPGSDAKITYYFDTDNSARPELKEDGSVDFFKLNNLHRCTAGQVLAEITPEVRGEDGVDVQGNVTPPREVKKCTFAYGRNMEISPDGLQLVSMVDGHVALIEGTVFVSDVYTVQDVGTSTGNIEYKGDVEVKGNVCENFSIKTTGNVFVNGVVEGAVIEAGGNIVIARGMHGQNKGRLKAGGNIIAKFISAAKVEADGFVEADQILNSQVSSEHFVMADTGKGLITGGRVVAKVAINAKNIGSPMGGSTIVEVGIDPEAKRRLAELQKSVGEKSKAIPQMKKVISGLEQKIKNGVTLTEEQMKNARMLQEMLAQTQAQVREELEEIETLDQMLKGKNNAHIDIRGTMYQGVAVSISGATMTVKNEYTFCRLVKKGADIASTNL